MGKLRDPHDPDCIVKQPKASSLENLIVFCPGCMDEQGHVGTIKALFNRRENRVIECTCNGECERCILLQIFKSSFNSEKMLVELQNRED